VFVHEVLGGHGLQGQQNDPLEIVGLGEHCRVDTLEIHWPDAVRSVSTFEDVEANQVLVIHQTDGLQQMSLEEYVGG